MSAPSPPFFWSEIAAAPFSCLLHFQVPCPVSYNSPLSTTPFPLINHPLPPKPPISMHFHAYTPPALKPCQTTSVNNKLKGSSSRCYTTVSLVRVTSSLSMESIICPFSADNNSGATGSINGNNFPHPDTLWSSVANSCVPLDTPQYADDRSCSNKASATASEDHGTGSWSCRSYACDTNDVGQYNNSQIKQLTDGHKDGSSDTICSTPQIPQPTFRSQKKPACTVSRDTEGAAPDGPPRTRARARAEVSPFSVRRRGRPFSAVEDALLRELVGRKLAWERIEEEFSHRFAGRGLKSLQGQWSRKLKFLACPAKRRPDACGRRSSS
ncbi:hypothetical protein BJX76DRAFT_365510 [Aspergillus varians]